MLMSFVTDELKLCSNMACMEKIPGHLTIPALIFKRENVINKTFSFGSSTFSLLFTIVFILINSINTNYYFR